MKKSSVTPDDASPAASVSQQQKMGGGGNTAALPFTFHKQESCVSSVQVSTTTGTKRNSGIGVEVVSPDGGRVGALKKHISHIEALVLFFSGRWMQSGDANAKDLRGQITSEMTNISLAAALFCTISIPAMFLSDEDSWKAAAEIEFVTGSSFISAEVVKGIYGLLTNLASAGLVTSVLLSVLFMLAVNECSTDGELKRFVEGMGTKLELPVLSFYFGVISFGGIVLAFWCFRSFPWYWFIAYTVIVYMGSFAFILPSISLMVRQLYLAKDGRTGIVWLSKGEVTVAWDKYILEQLQGNSELMELESFREFILTKSRAQAIASVTDQRISLKFEKERDLLAEK